MSAPRVYAAINAVAGELAKCGIAKNGINREDGYDYRLIDDVYERLAPLLARHKLCILPRMLERVTSQCSGAGGNLLVSVMVRIAFDLVSARDGSIHVIEVYGEALDSGDKATAKAMTAAYKQAMFQMFCIPVSGTPDADANSPRLARSTRATEPVQGWAQWTEDLEDMVRVCMTGEAIDRVQNSHRGLLAGLSRERPEFYSRLGGAIAARRRELAAPVPKVEPAQAQAKPGAKAVQELPSAPPHRERTAHA